MLDRIIIEQSARANRLARWGIALSCLAAAIAVMSLFVTLAYGQPQAVQKLGQCPSGYAQSGNYCVPMSANAPVAVPKLGQCPSSYITSGGYCVEPQRRRGGQR